jgi:hypothetical protein
MREAEQAAIERYIKQITRRQDTSREDLQGRVLELSTQAATERLELIESEVERLAPQLGYEQALTQTIERWEGLELEEKTRADRRRREQVMTELQERGEA